MGAVDKEAEAGVADAVAALAAAAAEAMVAGLQKNVLPPSSPLTSSPSLWRLACLSLTTPLHLAPSTTLLAQCGTQG